MMRQKTLCTVFVCLLVAGFCVTALAVDTSPYLMSDFYTVTGTTNASYTSFFIMNPTPIELTVLAAFYNEDGVFSSCVSAVLGGNETWQVSLRGIDVPLNGAAKFFAFPAGTRKFDPNVVIGGIKRETDCDWSYGDGAWVWFVREANMKAVTINSSTIGEFTNILKKVCPQYQGTYTMPQTYCEALPPPKT